MICPLCQAANDAAAIVCQQCGSNLAQAAVLADLRERVALLEQNMEALQGKRPFPTPDPPPPAEPDPPPPANETPVRHLLPDDIWQSDFWLNKVGIALLLLALAFLFNYAVDQGWLTPAVRVGMGLLLGTGLLGFSYRLAAKRPSFSQVLSGGGIAAYYISGFAAFQLYELVPYLAAFIFMVFVTLIAFLISLRQNEAMLSLIGGLGGLATPFLLNTDSGNVTALIVYTALLTGSLTLIYYVKGWQLVHWLANVGGWLILFAAMVGEDINNLPTMSPTGIVLQLGIAFHLLLFWAVPTWRTLRPLPAPQLGVGDSLLGPRLRAIFASHVHVATLLNPLVAWGLTSALWDVTTTSRGILSLTTAVFFALLAYLLIRHHDGLAYSHALVALLFLAIATLQLLDDNWLFLAWVGQTAVLHLATRHINRRSLRGLAHLFSLIIAIWLFTRLTAGVVLGETAVWNLNTATDLLAILSLFATTLPFAPSRLRTAYHIALHIAFLALLWRELSQLPAGQGAVTIAWGIYAVSLLIFAVRYQHPQARTTALATLFLLVGKLFLVDLEAVETIWRILLFAGFGGLFLLISYFYGSWLGIGETADEPPA